MSQHKDLPPNSQAWAKEVDALMDEVKQLKEVVRRLTENAGIDFSNPKRGLNPVSEMPSTNNPVGQKLSSLADVQIYNVADKQVLNWSQKDQRWLPVTLPTPSAGGFFPIPMSYESDIVGFGDITGTGPVWNGTENTTKPIYSYVGTKPNGVTEQWGSRSVYMGAGYWDNSERGWTYLEQQFNNGDSFTAIEVVSLSNTGARFIVNSSAVSIQYAPFYLEKFGSTNRPAMGTDRRNFGGSVYDEDLGIPIWWNGDTWTNALGTAV